MYVITRVYEVEPGQARRAATLAAKLAKVFVDAGQRSETTISFKGGTLPGETNRVYMRWTAERIESPYRAGNTLPDSGSIGTDFRRLTVRSWIEFEELLTEDKWQE